MHTLDNNYNKIVSITLPNKQEYCQRYGYDLSIDDFTVSIPEHEKSLCGDASVQHKLYLLKTLLSNNNYDWIVWIDADALIMNMTIPLEQVIDDNYEFIAGEDWNGINAGVLFFKVCDASRYFIDACIAYKPTEYDKTQTPFWWWPSDQCAFTRCVHLLKTKIVHHSQFNAYLHGPRMDNDWRAYNIGPIDPNWTQRNFQLGDFILHLVGDYIQNKIANAHTFSQYIIR